MVSEKMTFVLLHGWGGSIKSLELLAKEIKKKDYNTILLEIPGHGDTPQMSIPWDMQAFSKWLKQKLKEKKIKENFILIGHSFGGKIILETVSSNTLFPKKIFLINSNGIKPKNSLKKLFFLSLSKIFQSIFKNKYTSPLKKVLYKYLIRETDYFNTSGNLRETFKLINAQHYDRKLKKITIPTIIIWGRNDKITPLWMGRKLAKLIQGSKLIELNGTHGLPLKNPKEVALQIISNI